MNTTSGIVGLIPFVPKRELILPCAGGEIKLYVIDGLVQLSHNDLVSRGSSRNRTVNAVSFKGYNLGFDAGLINVPEELYQKSGLGIEYGHCEVVFRLVPHDRYGQQAEVVAISFDECKTFYENRLCTLRSEYQDPVVA